MYPLEQSTLITIPFFVHDANGDAVTGLTDGSFTKRISKDGTTWAAMTVTITEEENGWYTAPFSTSHTDTVGITTVVFTNAGAKQVNLQFRVDANLPDTIAVNLATVDTVVDAILIDTNEIGGAVGASISADIAAVKAETVLIVADTGTDGVKIAAGEIKTTTFGSGAINAAAISTGAITSAKIESGAIGADELATSAVTEIRSVQSGTASGGSTTTLIDASLTQPTDYWKGQTLLITNGNNNDLSRLITGFDSVTDTLTFAPALPNAIVGHNWEILPGARVDVEALLGDGQSAIDLKDFADAGYDPGTNQVQGVLLVDTTTTNTDMVGTDSAATAAALATTDGKVDTINTATAGLAGAAMRGTDSAALATVLGTPAGADIAADIAANATPTEVLTQVNAALDTAIAEIAQGVPSATPSLRNAAMLMYMALRDRLDVDTSGTDALEVYNDAGVVIAKKLVTDDGTTYSEAKMVTGP